MGSWPLKTFYQRLILIWPDIQRTLNPQIFGVYSNIEFDPGARSIYLTSIGLNYRLKLAPHGKTKFGTSVYF